MRIKIKYNKGYQWSILNQLDNVIYTFHEVELRKAQDIIKSWCSSWFISPKVEYLNLGEYSKDKEYRSRFFDQGRSI